MTKKMKKGQTMVEYIIIVALIAIALVGIFSFFGKTVHKKVKGAAEELTTEKATDTYEEGSEKIKNLGENN